MALLNPFANLGIRTPAIKTPQLPALLKPSMAPPASSFNFFQTPAKTNYAPLPPTQWGTAPAIKIPTQPVIPTTGSLPQGYNTNWGTQTASWAMPPMPPAPTMAKLTTPATPAKTPAKTAVKTPVVAPKAK